MKKTLLASVLFSCFIFILGCGGNDGGGKKSLYGDGTAGGSSNIVDGKVLYFGETGITGKIGYEQGAGGSWTIFESGKTYELEVEVEDSETHDVIEGYDTTGTKWTLSSPNLGNFSGASSATGTTVVFTAGEIGATGNIKVSLNGMWYQYRYRIDEEVIIEVFSL